MTSLLRDVHVSNIFLRVCVFYSFLYHVREISSEVNDFTGRSSLFAVAPMQTEQKGEKNTKYVLSHFVVCSRP